MTDDEKLVKKYMLNPAAYPIQFNLWVIGFIILLFPALFWRIADAPAHGAAVGLIMVCVWALFRFNRDIRGNKCIAIIDEKGLTCLAHCQETLEWVKTLSPKYSVIFVCNLRWGTFTPIGKASIESLRPVTKVIVERGGASLLVTTKYSERFKLTHAQLLTCYDNGLPTLQVLLQSPGRAIDYLTETRFWRAMEHAAKTHQDSTIALVQEYMSLAEKKPRQGDQLNKLLKQIRANINSTSWRDDIRGQKARQRIGEILGLETDRDLILYILEQEVWNDLNN